MSLSIKRKIFDRVKTAVPKLRGFIEYKAKLAGVPVVAVDFSKHEPDMLGVRASRQMQSSCSRNLFVPPVWSLRSC